MSRLRVPRAVPASVDASETTEAESPEPLLIVVECDGVLCDVHLDGHREAFNEVRPISHQSPYDRVRVVNAIP